MDLSNQQIEILREDINELNELLKSATRENVKSHLKYCVECIETEIKRIEEGGITYDTSTTSAIHMGIKNSLNFHHTNCTTTCNNNNTTNNNNNNNNNNDNSNNTNYRTNAPIKVKDANLSLDDSAMSYSSFPSYSWDQSHNKITVFLTVKTKEGIIEKNVFPKFEEKSIEIKVHNLENKNYRFCVKKLYDKIIPKKCFIKVKKNSIHVTLIKERGGTWENLYYKETVMSKMKTPQLDGQTEPSQMLMDMMKQLYQEGDSEMKRTIAKAWHEANEKRDTLNVPNF